jgi:hypothetical protein
MVGPHNLPQGIFRHQPVGMGDQVMQYVEDFGCQGNRLHTTPETGVVWIEAKVSEVTPRGGHP